MTEKTSHRRPLLAACLTLALTGCAAGQQIADGALTQTAGVESASGEPAHYELDQAVLYELLVAEFALKRRNLSVAVQRYLTAARTTRDPGVAERATRVAVFARDDLAALQAAEIWRETDAQSVAARAVYAALLVRLRQPAPAAAALRNLITHIHDNHTRGLNLFSDMLGRGKDKQAALEALTAAAPDFADAPKSLFILANLAARLGDPDRAVGLLDQVHKLDPKDINAIVLHAQVLRSDKKTVEAAAFLRQAIADNPGSDDLRLTYARLLVELKRYDDARKEFELLAERLPKNADVRFALGLLLLQTDKTADAAKQFDALILLGRRVRASHYYLGQIAELDGDVDGAKRHYGYVDRGEHYISAQIRIAVLLANGGRIDRAREHLSGVRRRGPNDAVRLYRAEAELLAKNDRLTDALEVYNLAIGEFPRDTDLLYARAMLAEKLDRLTDMERDLRAILGHDPNNADAMNALGYTLADRTDRLEEAKALIEKALAIKPDDHFVIDSMGWVLYRMGKLEQALVLLRRALKLNEDSEIAAHLGEVLWVMGRKDDAREVWDSALKARPKDKRLLEVIERFQN